MITSSTHTKNWNNQYWMV